MDLILGFFYMGKEFIEFLEIARLSLMNLKLTLIDRVQLKDEGILLLS